MKTIYALILLPVLLLSNASAKESCVSNSLITKAADLALKDKSNNVTVLDLGTGSGRNMIGLLKKGATVYAYDADHDAINSLRKEFKGQIKQKKLILDEVLFEDIPTLPRANLIIAWRALPFMEKDKFPAFWQKIEKALAPNGIFVGTFFGEQHKTKRPLDRAALSLKP